MNALETPPAWEPVFLWPLCALPPSVHILRGATLSPEFVFLAILCETK